nr:MAG TPA: hypothetical protein [Caudoviricetes sp.]
MNYKKCLVLSYFTHQLIYVICFDWGKYGILL